MNMCELRGGSCGRAEAAGSRRHGHSGRGSPVSTHCPSSPWGVLGQGTGASDLAGMEDEATGPRMLGLGGLAPPGTKSGEDSSQGHPLRGTCRLRTHQWWEKEGRLSSLRKASLG